MKLETQQKTSIASLFSSAPLAGIVKTMAAAAATVALLAAFSARAGGVLQTYTWDPLQNTTGSDGPGTWDTSSLLWASGGQDVAWPNTATVAIIGSDLEAAGTITLSSGTIITNDGITFDAALSGNYVLTGGTNYLGGATPTITVNGSSATILSPLQGTSGLTTAGTGTLVLGGTNSYSGATAITAGTVQLTNSYASALTAANYPALTNAVPGTPPVLFMSFNDVSGTTVYNEGSGVSMNGVLTGSGESIAPGEGPFGNALRIGSTLNAGYVLISSPVVALTNGAVGAWTVATWVKSTTPGGVYAYQGAGSWATGNMNFYLNAGQGVDTWGSHAGCVSYAQGFEEGTISNLTDGNWHFVAMTCNSGTIAMYVDGNLDAASSSFAATKTGTGTQFRIGASADAGDGNAALNGLIADFYVYNIALTQAQVQAIMTATTNAAQPLPQGTTVSVAANSKLDLNGNSAYTAGLSGAGTVDTTLASGAAILSINNSSADNFTGLLTNTAGTLSLMKSGAGTLTLSGADYYTGSTIVTGGALTLSDTTNTTSSVTVSDGATLTIGPNHNVSAGMYDDGGTLNLQATNTTALATRVATGTLNITGSLTSTASTAIMTIGSDVGNAVVNFSGVGLTNYYYDIGVVNGAVGALYQTSGTLDESAGGSGSAIQIGNAVGAYGYYMVGAGATVLCGEVGVAGEGNSAGGNVGGSGNGVMEVFGTVNDTAWFVMTRASAVQTGVLNIYPGGTLNWATTTSEPFRCNWGTTGQTAIINMLGGTLATTKNATIDLNDGNTTANTGILNLDGGVVQPGWLSNTHVAKTYVNFNGGTLQANETQGSMMTGFAGSYVYANGGTVNNNAFNITIAQPLLAPTGNGVYGIGSLGGGLGYVAPPIVLISGGGGTSATAIAQIDTNSGSGTFSQVTNVIITCPGFGYTSAPTFTLSGGGPSTAATITGTAPTANTSGGMTFTGAATTTLTGASTYTGITTISSGTTLTLSGSGALAGPINVTSGAVFTPGSSTLPNETLEGSGTVNGALTTAATTTIYPGLGTAVGTLAFNNNLTLAYGATTEFALSTTGTSDSGINDQITVAGALTVLGSGASSNSITIKALSGTSPLDQTADYVLINGPTSITGGFNAGPIWLTPKPSNFAHFTVTNDTVNNQVRLTYSANANPSVAAATATPSTGALRNQPVLISVTAQPVGAAISSVSVTLSSGTVPLHYTGSGNVWTNTVVIPAATLAGTVNVPVLITDALGNTGSGFVTVGVVASTETWSGGGVTEYFDNNLDWAVEAGETAAYAPGYVGDTLVFAGTGGTAGLSPNMDNPYTVAGLSFSSGAGSFNITPDLNGDPLTLSGGAVVNNSASPQTLGVPIVLTAAQVFDATAGNIILGGVISDSGNGLTVNGPYSVTLAGANTYTGQTVVNSGTLNITGTVSTPVPIMMLGSTTAAGSAVMNVSGGGNLTIDQLYIGNFTNGVGAVYQTGGVVTDTNYTGVDNLSIGNIQGSYGYYDAAGGTLSVNGIAVGGEDNNAFGFSGSGIMEINGGAVTDYGWVVLARDNAHTTGSEAGILNVYSGSLLYSGGGIVGPWDTGETGIINIMGGTVANISTNAVGVRLGYTGYMGILNLNGGSLQAALVSGYNGPGYAAEAYGQVNFNGGTLMPCANSTSLANFITVTAADIYSGGATINNNGQVFTVSQPLLAPAGNGVTTPTITSGGAGYIAPPIVLISGGGGTNATAIAQIDTTASDPKFGQVTNIIITSPGVSYTSPPTFTLSGGGFTAAATITGTAPTANTSGGLTVTDTVGGGNLTLTGASTYTGATTISSGGYLSLGVGGSINDSSIIDVQNGGTFDVTALTSPSLAASQNLKGSGQVNTPSSGSGLATSSSSAIYPGEGAAGGTLTINGNLTMTIGSTAVFDLSSSSGGNNDQMTVNDTLTLNGNVLHVAAASLDGTDYTLIQAGNISGSFATTPAWDVKPSNYLNYTVVTSGSTVVLHYSTYSPPTGTGSANPTSVLRNESTAITVNTTPGSFPIQSVTITLNNSVTYLSQSPANVWTGTVTIPPTTLAGSLILSAAISDNNSPADVGNALIPLTVVTSTETWNGGDSLGNENFDDNLDWAIEAGQSVAYAPGYIGDSLVFAGNGGTAGPNPSMDQNYTIGSLTFNSGASSFDIGTSGYTLTLSGAPVVNNSANPQTLNLPITLTAAQPFDATAGSITVSGAIADSGNGLTVAGPYTVSLAGNNTYTGPTLVNSGALAVPGLISPTGVITVGDVADSNAVLNIDGGTVQANNTAVGQFGSSLVVGTVSGSAGDVQMSGSGSVLSTSEQLGLGTGAGGYAAFSMSGGTAQIGSFLVVGFNNDRSVVNMSGGALSIGRNLMTIGAGGSASIGVVTLSGGTFTSTATTGYAPTIGGTFVGEYGTGILNVSGSALLTLSGWGLRIGQDAGANGTVNLLGGTINTSAVSQGAGSALFNFNGGTLQAGPTANTTAFMPNLNSAYVYSGGAFIDENGSAITIAQPLLAPSGLGISSIPLTSHGSGYIDTPIITITGGTGSGATAVAQINPATGAVTNIWITNPGNGYASGDAGSLVITFLGGGGSGASAGTPVLAADGGGLTVIDTAGGGKLTLTGASTYTGPTTITSGSDLVLGVGGSISNSSSIEVTNGAYFDVSALASYVVPAGQTLTGSGGIFGAVTVNGTVSPGETAGISIGPLNLNGNNLTLNGSANFRINKTGTVLTSDQITGIGTAIYGGNLVLTSTGSTPLTNGDSFTLFSASAGSGSFTISGVPGVTFTFNASTGVLTVASVGPVINPNPPVIGYTYNAGSSVLTLSWPTNAGWILQSNSISLANTSDWFDVAGSSNVTTLNITNNKSSPAVFYRMVYP